jgi:protease I
MDLEGKRVAILVEDNYEALEVWYPNLCLHEAGAEVSIIGPRARSYMSSYGLPVQADVSADHVQAKDFDAIVIPGGSAAEAISQQPGMLALIDEAIHQGKLLAMIVSTEQPLTITPDDDKKNMRDLLGKRGNIGKEAGRYENGSVIRDSNLIKAYTPADLPAFCRMIIAALSASHPSAAANANQD